MRLISVVSMSIRAIPLFVGYLQNADDIIVESYLLSSQSLTYPGGIPSSLTDSGEQWDFPNAWPPHQYHVIMALQEAGKEDLAFQLAQRWVQSNYEAYIATDPSEMYEKYNCTTFGLSGGGGEYKVQTGFGWTNGVVLEFLDRWGDKMRAPNVTRKRRGAPFIHKYVPDV